MMRRGGRTRQPDRTLTTADPRVGFVIEKLDVASGLQELFSKAEELISKGKWQEAAQTCRSGLDIQPYDLTGLLLLGTALWKMGEAEEAERILTLAHKELVKNAHLYSILAEISHEKGDFERAEKMHSFYRVFLQTDSDQMLSPPAETASVSGEDAESPKSQVLKRLTLLIEAFEGRSPVNRSKTSLFTDGERDILRRILQNG